MKDKWANHPAHLSPVPALHPPKNPPISSPSLPLFQTGMESRGDEQPQCSGDPPEEQQQRMASSSVPEQQTRPAAATAAAPAAAAAAPAGAGRVAPDRAAAAALRRQVAAQRAREKDAFSANVSSARSLADQNLSRREQLKGLKEQLGDLQLQLREALTLQSRSESKRNHATESIAAAEARNKRLGSLVADSKAKRDLRAEAKSLELKALETLEAERDGYAETDAQVTKGLLWFDRFLGFRVVGGEEVVKFVFDKIDPQRPEKEYSFRISPRLQFVDCDPHVKDIEELAKDLDLNEHLFKFVRMAREKFQSSFMNGTLSSSPVVGPDVSAVPLSSPIVKSVNSTSKDAHSQSQSRSKNDVLPAKRGATAMSGASPGLLRRRSPRLEGTQ